MSPSLFVNCSRIIHTLKCMSKYLVLVRRSKQVKAGPGKH